MNTKRGRGATEKAAKGMTDWNQLKALPDSDIVLTDDAPGTMPDDWAEAVAHRGLPLPSRTDASLPDDLAKISVATRLTNKPKD